MNIAGDKPPEPKETPTNEGREFRSLVTGANVGQIFDAAINHGTVDGETAELQQHYGLNANQVPLTLMIRDLPDDLETRAVTPAPSDVGQNQQTILPYVFPDSAASFLNVHMPTVGVGEAVYPVLTSTLSVGTPAENADQAETTGAFSADVLSPSRIQASYFYSREDRARFQSMDSALRENLSMGLSDGLDKQILAGTNGLFSGTNIPNNNVSAATTYADYITQHAYGRVDGRYVSTAGGVKVLFGSSTYAHAGNVYRNNSVDRTALDRLMEITGGVMVSAHVPAVASHKQNGIIRRGTRADMVAPVWEGVTIIPDEVTKAKAGQIVITAVMLHAVKVLRTDGFYKQQTQHQWAGTWTN